MLTTWRSVSFTRLLSKAYHCFLWCAAWTSRLNLPFRTVFLMPQLKMSTYQNTAFQARKFEILKTTWWPITRNPTARLRQRPTRAGRGWAASFACRRQKAWPGFCLDGWLLFPHIIKLSKEHACQAAQLPPVTRQATNVIYKISESTSRRWRRISARCQQLLNHSSRPDSHYAGLSFQGLSLNRWMKLTLLSRMQILDFRY